jgi:hypothetical protein
MVRTLRILIPCLGVAGIPILAVESRARIEASGDPAPFFVARELSSAAPKRLAIARQNPSAADIESRVARKYLVAASPGNLSHPLKTWA